MEKLSQFKQANSAAFVFRLYVAGEAPNSILALRNLKEICLAHYADNYHIDVVDVLLSPEHAWTEGVTVTPMVLRITPLPQLQIMGNLSNTPQVLTALGLGTEGHV